MKAKHFCLAIALLTVSISLWAASPADAQRGGSASNRDTQTRQSADRQDRQDPRIQESYEMPGANDEPRIASKTEDRRTVRTQSKGSPSSHIRHLPRAPRKH